jgi:hypothetical protein
MNLPLKNPYNLNRVFVDAYYAQLCYSERAPEPDESYAG